MIAFRGTSKTFENYYLKIASENHEDEISWKRCFLLQATIAILEEQTKREVTQKQSTLQRLICTFYKICTLIFTNILEKFESVCFSKPNLG